MTNSSDASDADDRPQAPSTELTAGTGFTYEDTVVAYYLSSLLLEGRAAGQEGVVTSVAVQQAGHGHPMDDVAVEFEDNAGRRILGLQVKRQLTISGAPSNDDFRGTMAAAVATLQAKDFQQGGDAYGFAVEHVNENRFRAFSRLLEWARASPSGDHFDQRFAAGGSAAALERALRDELLPLTGAATSDQEICFYRHFVALHMNGLIAGGVFRNECVNRLQEILVASRDGEDLLLFDRLCRLVREGGGYARKWTRQSLLAQLRGVVQLRVVPNLRSDIDTLKAFSLEGLGEISETVDDTHIARPALQSRVAEQLAEKRLVNISGLPGCGKSAVLKHFACEAVSRGPILFLKSDRLHGSGWTGFAASLGLRHPCADILAEIGSAGSPILFIDGIDRIRPDQKGIVVDLLRIIESSSELSHWRVLATSRDQGLETYRAWFPANFYRASGIGDVSVGAFSDDEAQALAEAKPNLKRLLFGPNAVQEIARRPFFAAVLARESVAEGTVPQTEIDLIEEWWARAGHDTLPDGRPLRRRALLDLAKAGVRNLGKSILAHELKEATFAQIASLQADLLIREHDGGSVFSFAHDIFFEWAFFRLLIDLGDNWHPALIEAGEPPLLGRVIGLLAQSKLSVSGRWTGSYRRLAAQPLRPQWRREWLTAPPFTAAFAEAAQEFEALLSENDWALLEKLLVWFQAQHTVPNPLMLAKTDMPVEGIDPIRAADLLGWPSDFRSWSRLLEWLTPRLPAMPTRLIPVFLEFFAVWQNALANAPNARSKVILEQCSRWLIELEDHHYAGVPIGPESRWRDFGLEALKNLASALRTVLLRSGRSHSQPAKAIYRRAILNKRMRHEAYADLMAFTLTMAEVDPDAIVAVAETELLEELPQERFDRIEQQEREYRAHIAELRKIPEAERTRHQQRALESHFPFIGHERYEIDDIGIDRHHSYYHRPSALHEPFASLFEHQPEAAIRLVNRLANHAVKGWRQIHALKPREIGTPLPVTVAFPWGSQTFWGDWRVYSWSQGHFAPQPLECAFLALSYWAFKQLEAGQPAEEVIKAITKDSECYANLGLALLIALESMEASEVTLPIVSCQRLWEHDLARLASEPTKNVDLLGFGFLSRLTGAKQRAKEFLDTRESRKRDVRQLAMFFALNADERLRNACKDALGAFPNDLPFQFEEEKTHSQHLAALKAKAERWSGLGDAANYKQTPASEDRVMVTYESPTPLSKKEEERLAENTSYLRAQGAIGWAATSLVENAPHAGMTIEGAIAYAKSLDTPSLFEERLDVGGHAAQSAVSSIAACVIRFDGFGSNLDWAWEVMSRIQHMKEPEKFSGSQIPWHPSIHLVLALVHDRKAATPREDTARRLLELTGHHLDCVSHLAFQGIFHDADDDLRWTAAHLAADLSVFRRPSYEEGKCDKSLNDSMRDESFSRAFEKVTSPSRSPFPQMPPAWAARARRNSSNGEEINWGEPDLLFDAQFAAKIFPQFPIETWCQSEIFRPMLEVALKQFVDWTTERLMPPWRDQKSQRNRQTDLYEWKHELGDLLARAAPYMEATWFRQELLQPFFSDDEEMFSVLASFADRMVTRHVFDALVVPENSIPLLRDCVDRIIQDADFDPKSYRAGEVHGHDMPKMIRALLFVSVEKADGAARFVNGNWTQIALIMPLVTRLVSAIGWSTFVMDSYLTLCERVGLAYPLDDFAAQTQAVLIRLPNAQGSWAGTMLPARIAGRIQKLADVNFPLRLDQAQALLRILDALIDLGDRRSAALEQTESFKTIQGPC